MFNPLPVLALGVVAIGYSSAIDHDDRIYTTAPNPSVVAFSAAPNLSVQDFVGKLPETVQEPLCDAKEMVTSSLFEDFAETFESAWVQQQNVKMELWASDLMGTWTLLRVEDDGLTCILLSGFGWAEGMGAEDVVQDRPLS